MLDNGMKHPSLTEIMEFVCLTKDDLKTENYAKYFGMVAHLAMCDRCSKIKERMEEFVRYLDNSLDAAAEKNLHMFRVFCSLEEINKADILLNRNVVLNVRAKLSKEVGKSKIFTDAPFGERAETELYTDEKNNRVFVEQEKINVLINDEGKKEMSLLVMSESEGKLPIFKDMQKSGEGWQISCECPEDEYDIVVL